jgi:hypothetical protein
MTDFLDAIKEAYKKREDIINQERTACQEELAALEKENVRIQQSFNRIRSKMIQLDKDSAHEEQEYIKRYTDLCDLRDMIFAKVESTGYVYIDEHEAVEVDKLFQSESCNGQLPSFGERVRLTIGVTSTSPFRVCGYCDPDDYVLEYYYEFGKLCISEGGFEERPQYMGDMSVIYSKIAALDNHYEEFGAGRHAGKKHRVRCKHHVRPGYVNDFVEINVRKITKIDERYRRYWENKIEAEKRSIIDSIQRK